MVYDMDRIIIIVIIIIIYILQGYVLIFLFVSYLR